MSSKKIIFFSFLMVTTVAMFAQEHVQPSMEGNNSSFKLTNGFRKDSEKSNAYKQIITPVASDYVQQVFISMGTTFQAVVDALSKMTLGQIQRLVEYLKSLRSTVSSTDTAYIDAMVDTLKGDQPNPQSTATVLATLSQEVAQEVFVALKTTHEAVSVDPLQSSIQISDVHSAQETSSDRINDSSPRVIEESFTLPTEVVEVNPQLTSTAMIVYQKPLEQQQDVASNNVLLLKNRPNQIQIKEPVEEFKPNQPAHSAQSSNLSIDIDSTPNGNRVGSATLTAEVIEAIPVDLKEQQLRIIDADSKSGMSLDAQLKFAKKQKKDMMQLQKSQNKKGASQDKIATTQKALDAFSARIKLLEEKNRAQEKIVKKSVANSSNNGPVKSPVSQNQPRRQFETVESKPLIIKMTTVPVDRSLVQQEQSNIIEQNVQKGISLSDQLTNVQTMMKVIHSKQRNENLKPADSEKMSNDWGALSTRKKLLQDKIEQEKQENALKTSDTSGDQINQSVNSTSGVQPLMITQFGEGDLYKDQVIKTSQNVNDQGPIFGPERPKSNGSQVFKSIHQQERSQQVSAPDNSSVQSSINNLSGGQKLDSSNSALVVTDLKPSTPPNFNFPEAFKLNNPNTTNYNNPRILKKLQEIALKQQQDVASNNVLLLTESGENQVNRRKPIQIKEPVEKFTANKPADSAESLLDLSPMQSSSGFMPHQKQLVMQEPEKFTANKPADSAQSQRGLSPMQSHSGFKSKERPDVVVVVQEPELNSAPEQKNVGFKQQEAEPFIVKSNSIKDEPITVLSNKQQLKLLEKQKKEWDDLLKKQKDPTSKTSQNLSLAIKNISEQIKVLSPDKPIKIDRVEQAVSKKDFTEPQVKLDSKVVSIKSKIKAPDDVQTEQSNRIESLLKDGTSLEVQLSNVQNKISALEKILEETDTPEQNKPNIKNQINELSIRKKLLQDKIEQEKKEKIAKIARTNLEKQQLEIIEKYLNEKTSLKDQLSFCQKTKLTIINALSFSPHNQKMINTEKLLTVRIKLLQDKIAKEAENNLRYQDLYQDGQAAKKKIVSFDKDESVKQSSSKVTTSKKDLSLQQKSQSKTGGAALLNIEPTRSKSFEELRARQRKSFEELRARQLEISPPVENLSASGLVNQAPQQTSLPILTQNQRVKPNQFIALSKSTKSRWEKPKVTIDSLSDQDLVANLKKIDALISQAKDGGEINAYLNYKDSFDKEIARRSQLPDRSEGHVDYVYTPMSARDGSNGSLKELQKLAAKKPSSPQESLEVVGQGDQSIEDIYRSNSSTADAPIVSSAENLDQALSEKGNVLDDSQSQLSPVADQHSQVSLGVTTSDDKSIDEIVQQNGRKKSTYTLPAKRKASSNPKQTDKSVQKLRVDTLKEELQGIEEKIQKQRAAMSTLSWKDRNYLNDKKYFEDKITDLEKEKQQREELIGSLQKQIHGNQLESLQQKNSELLNTYLRVSGRLQVSQKLSKEYMQFILSKFSDLTVNGKVLDENILEHIYNLENKGFLESLQENCTTKMREIKANPSLQTTDLSLNNATALGTGFTVNKGQLLDVKRGRGARVPALN